MLTWPETFLVKPHDRQPLIDFMISALRESGCQIITAPAANQAPFRFSFETPQGERIGVIAYAFHANSKQTKNRPSDECRFQVKYGSKDGRDHQLWQDPAGLYVTLFLGIDPIRGIFVAADPVLHSPTKFFISIEFKEKEAEVCRKKGWHAWERDRQSTDTPIEVLVGGTAASFLRYIRFEREALGEDQGHRHLLADKPSPIISPTTASIIVSPDGHSTVDSTRVHELAHELQLGEREVLDLIQSARRLKMAVRGWVAEVHLVRSLERISGVSDCKRLDEEGGSDVSLRYQGSRPLIIECKNVLRATAADGNARMDFQRTRASKSDPCSRFYGRKDFDIVAACLHAVCERWEFKFAPTSAMDGHGTCVGKLSNRVKIDAKWSQDIANVLRQVVAA